MIHGSLLPLPLVYWVWLPAWKWPFMRISKSTLIRPSSMKLTFWMVIFLLKYRHMLLQITGYVFPRDASCAVILTCIWRSGGPVGNIAIFPVLSTRSIPSDSVYIIRRQEKIPPQDVWRCSYISTWQRLPGMPFNSHTELRKQLKW